MMRGFAILIIVGTIGGCVSLPPPLSPADLERVQTRIYEQPFDRVFTAVTEVLQDEGYPLKTVDSGSGFILTEVARPPKFRSVTMEAMTGMRVLARWDITVKKVDPQQIRVRARLFITTTYDPGNWREANAASDESHPGPEAAHYKPFFEKLEAKFGLPKP